VAGDVSGARAHPNTPRVHGAVTIYDIARVTGLSPSTVSRGLSKPGRLNATTQERIRQAAADLGYRTNPMARALNTGKTGTVALILPNITNPVFFDLIRGVEKGTAEAGFTLVLAETRGRAERETETTERLLPTVDGFILVASRMDEGQVRELAARKPVVMANRPVPGVPGISTDYTTGTAAALQLLADQGHESIAFLSAEDTPWISRARWENILTNAPSRGMKVVEIAASSATIEAAGASLPRVLASGVTAVHTFNDLMAIGLLQACRSAGVVVPDELSIIGFDDIFGATFTSPPLTTIRAPLGTLGYAAVRHLLSLQDPNEEHEQLRSSLPTELVVRDSVARPAVRD